MKIAAHTLVKNEEKFVWYAVSSVINYIDKIYLWDTGSSDNTPQILKEIKKLYGTKVDLKFLKPVDIHSFTNARQQMLDSTKEDWFIMLDGDEIWWESSIVKLISKITANPDLESIVVPTVNLVGDIYHYQEAAAGKYKLAGKVGHLNLRAINRKLPGLKSDRPHGTWGWTDGDGKMIQDRDQNKIKYINTPYLHASFLQRAGEISKQFDVPKRTKKLKHEIGENFPLDYYYPESFFVDKPDIIPSPWQPMTKKFKFRATLETPLRKLNRRIMPTKIGY